MPLFCNMMLKRVNECAKMLISWMRLAQRERRKPAAQFESSFDIETERWKPSPKKAGLIMCKASEVGKIVVNKCLDRHLFINTQKLQKLLVLMQIECIRRTQKPLFKEDVRIWSCGVAIKEVDDEFCSYAEGFSERQEEFITLLDGEEKSVDLILDQYGHLDVFELSKLPENKKVAQLGVSGVGSHTPHVSYQILTGAFINDITSFCE